MSRTCAMPHCDNEIPDGARGTTVHCVNCRGTFSRWSKRTVRAIVYRRQRLALFTERMKTVAAKKEKR